MNKQIKKSSKEKDTFKNKLQEHLEMKLSCIKTSLQREHNHNSFTKRLNIVNISNGEITNVSSYVKSQIKNNQALNQKTSALIEIALKLGLTSVFITLTNPSEYHPFISNGQGDKFVRRNPNFKFETIDAAIKEGYKNLNKIFRNFYKRTKELSKNIYYICCFEPHKSGIPHIHLLLFINEEYITDLKKVFSNQVKTYKLKKTDCKILNDAKKESSLVAAYIKKYMFKTLETSNDNSEDKQLKQSYSRYIDGWKKKYKIRQFKMSNLPLNLDIYKKLYHSLDRDYLNQLIKKLSTENKSLFKYFMENINITKTVHNLDTNTFIQKENSLNTISEKEFEVVIYVEEQSKYIAAKDINKKFQKITQFVIYHNVNNETNLIYDKQNYQVFQDFKNKN